MKKEGFTLVEFLIVIGIIIILSALAIVAINPGEQIQKARDKQRVAHISAIYGAINEYRMREGIYPACVTTNALDVIVCQEVLVPDYFTKLPQDPDENCLYETGYFIKKNTFNSLGVIAACAESEEEISVGAF